MTLNCIITKFIKMIILLIAYIQKNIFIVSFLVITKWAIRFLLVNTQSSNVLENVWFYTLIWCSTQTFASCVHCAIMIQVLSSAPYCLPVIPSTDVTQQIKRDDFCLNELLPWVGFLIFTAITHRREVEGPAPTMTKRLPCLARYEKWDFCMLIWLT